MMQKLKASGQVTVDKATYQDYTIKDLRIHYQYAKGVMKVDPLGLQFWGRGLHVGGVSGRKTSVCRSRCVYRSKDLKRNGHRKAWQGGYQNIFRFSTPLHPSRASLL